MPTLQVELSEEEYQQLNDWACEQGQPVEVWLRDALSAAVQRRAQAKSRLEAFQEWVQCYASDETPTLPLESLRRENLCGRVGCARDVLGLGAVLARYRSVQVVIADSAYDR